ncbi:potassium channel family protein [Aeromonas veronii]|uniref:potassium channel family protein n=1 Tax=Aeromonas veronii TaxID=654 RepID=UPI0022306151|nr:potassium channel family protein [Aeromonas veronii]EKP0300689.1 two pore domain potassium channel family protein [Aeromonas veronii]EKP0301993.1 two pore domain potassium channel family protein [Aeromonas veronii]UZE59277.1 potassium channel family protein [Aeromonas veronii]
MQKKETLFAWWFFTPTYKYAEYCKNALINQGASSTELSSALKKYNTRYFISSLTICLAVQLLSTLESLLFPVDGFESLPVIKYIYWLMVTLVVWSFLLSRAIEITKAFLGDAIDKLNGELPNSDLRYGERLKLALTSYIELIINFGTLYFLMPACFFKDFHKFNSVLEAIYFSGVTITTIGYGDISPNIWFLQLLTVFEVLSGFSLIVVCFTIYSSLALSKAPVCKICARKLGK